MARARLVLSCTLAAALLSADAEAQTAGDLYELGVASRQGGDLDAAEDYLVRALRLAPENTDALVQLGFTRLALGDVAAARRDFTRALELAPDYVDAEYGLALVEFRSGQVARAQVRTGSLLGRAPENAAYRALAESLAEAAEAADERRRRERLARRLQEAQRLRLEGRAAAAEAGYRRALTLDPGNADALVGLGLAAAAQGRFAAAERAFDRVLARDPANLDARLGLVRAALGRGDPAEARRRLDALRRAAPDNAEALLLDAQVAFGARDYGRAQRLFAAAARRETTRGAALVGLGDVLRTRGRNRAAREAYGAALALEPDSERIRARLAAPPVYRWRVDLATQASDLSDGLPSWRDSTLAISRQVTPETSVAVRVRHVERFGLDDAQLTATLSHRFAPSVTGYGGLGWTPDAEILARLTLEAGATWQAVRTGRGAVVLGLAGRVEDYRDRAVTTLTPSLSWRPGQDGTALTLRLVHSSAGGGQDAAGYVARGDVNLGARARLFFGYADAPEVSQSRIFDTEAAFAGLSVDVAEGWAVTATLARESRAAFDRDTLALGLTARF